MATGTIRPLLHEAGFEVVMADIRGFGGSYAQNYEGFISEREIQDGVEFLEWVAAAAFCEGQTATCSGSYHGHNQLLFASRHPRGLRCIAPMVSPVDTYRDWTNQGGIPSDTKWAALAYPDCGQEATMRRGSELYTNLLGRPDDDHHRDRSAEYVLDQVTVPTLCIEGWYDFFLRGTLHAFCGVRGPKRLVIGPWGHSGFAATHQQELVRWYRYWLRGEGDNPALDAPVRLWDRGMQQWHEQAAWPESTAIDWFTVGPISKPTPVAVAATIAAYPNSEPDDVPITEYLAHIGSGFDNHLWGAADTFDAGPIHEDVFLLGPVGLTIWLSTDGCHNIDVYARVSVRRTNGTTLRLSEGRLRAGYRSLDLDRSHRAADGTVIVPWHPHRSAEPLPQRQPIPLTIEMEPVCAHLTAADHITLAVSIVSTDTTDSTTVTVLPDTAIHLPVGSRPLASADSHQPGPPARPARSPMVRTLSPPGCPVVPRVAGWICLWFEGREHHLLWTPGYGTEHCPM